MARYNLNSYDDEDEPPFWVKGLLVLVLCAVVSGLLWVAKRVGG